MKKEKKKEHLGQQIVFHFRSEDISFVEKHYLPQNTKHLKGKKRQKGNIWKRWIVAFFLYWSNIFFFLEKKCISTVEWKKKISTVMWKKRYQRWCEKHNDFFGNFFIILASNTNFVSKNLNLRRPTKISLKNLFFLAKQHILFVSEENLFFRPKYQCWRLRFKLKHTMLLLQMLLGCCKGVCKWLAHDFKTCQQVLMAFAND